MRAKLRLDLEDVRKQIKEYEELLKQDKSPENVEAHRKLVQYEKKLKDQYEQISGISIDQAETLGTRVREDVESSKFSGFLGILAGFMLYWGVYNTLLHSIVGFGPMDIINVLTGSGEKAPSAEYFAGSLLYDTSKLLVVAPIAAGIVLLFLSFMFEKSRGTFYGFLEFLGYGLFLGLFVFLIYPVVETEDLLDALSLYYSVLGLVGILGGIAILVSGMGHKGFLSKGLTIISGLLIMASGAQFLLFISDPSGVTEQIVDQWTFIMMPTVIASLLLALVNFFKFFK